MTDQRAGSIQKNCAACGDLITVRLADHKRGWGRFCDKACAAAHKCGQRPRDVNAYHAKCGSAWAAEKLRDFAEKYNGAAPPVAPAIRSQVGRVTVRPAYHSPAKCWTCGDAINGPGLCIKCADHEAAMDATEYGWDGHKNAF